LCLLSHTAFVITNGITRVEAFVRRENSCIHIQSCFCSLAQSHLILYEPMDCSIPGFSDLHHILELAQTHVHWICDAIQPSHPVVSSSCLKSIPASGSFLKSLLMKVKEESENAGLTLNIQKTKIMASGPITSWQIYGKTMETVRDFIFLGFKITADSDCSHEIKRRSLEEKLWQAKTVKEQRH